MTDGVVVANEIILLFAFDIRKGPGNRQSLLFENHV